ncbi:DNA cytosine methyltransferase [Bradyrhizobium sp. HKCCYLRH1062]|uniref:DNA cytosine methyltransferase n=1 Tax=unclassified Bradyrhizobium TaxID=2631580 RepID=UPI003EBA8E85
MTTRAISLFCGAGGFCEGARMAGWKVVAAVESDAQACQTHAANFPEVKLHEGDIAGFLKARGHREAIGAKPVDVVYGGPPCQGFSQIGPRDLTDPRNALYKEFVRICQTVRARTFVMENVPNMVAMKNGHFRTKILSAFASAGYRRTAIVPVLASEFGVPQDRRRVFIFGVRDDLDFDGDFAEAAAALIEKQKADKSVTVREALSDLPAGVAADDGVLPYPHAKKGALSQYQKLMRLDCDQPLLSSKQKRSRLDKDELFNHHTKGIQERRKAILKAIKPGARGDSLPKELWNGTRGHKWRRLDPDKPSYTILAQMHRDLSEWIHPTYDRWITVREAARLQSFHDGFVFHGSEWQQLKQVGNAVPPLLGLSVARAAEGLLALTG